MEIPFPSEVTGKPISPMVEMVAYEALWKNRRVSFSKLSKMFAGQPGKLPSDFVTKKEMEELYPVVRQAALNPSIGYKTNILVNGAFDYPTRLREAEDPIEVLYYSGNIDLLSTRIIAVVGTRKPSPQGLRQAAQVAEFMVKNGFTIISGLASGIDTMAHQTAIAHRGHTIAVLGTPLDHTYPSENAELQKKIALEHLLITQVPFIRYREQGIKGNRLFFPERNKTMSALSEATVVVEAGETSGTLIQARAALHQRRKLFILENCFERPDVTWPREFLEQGAVRIREFEEILRQL
jgi:DNA processing protein